MQCFQRVQRSIRVSEEIESHLRGSLGLGATNSHLNTARWAMAMDPNWTGRDDARQKVRHSVRPPHVCSSRPCRLRGCSPLSGRVCLMPSLLPLFALAWPYELHMHHARRAGRNAFGTRLTVSACAFLQPAAQKETRSCRHVQELK